MIRYNGYIVDYVNGSANLLGVATEGRGGKIPDCLSGWYTTPALAQLAIDNYIESKVKKDAKTANESRG